MKVVVEGIGLGVTSKVVSIRSELIVIDKVMIGLRVVLA